MAGKNRFLVFAFLLLSPCFFSQLISTSGTQQGLLDASGRVILDAVYDTVYQLKETYKPTSLFVYGSASKYGFYNAASKSIVPMNYDEIKVDSDGFFYIRNGNLWGFITRGEASKIIEPAYSAVYAIKNRGVAKNEDLYGVIQDSLHGACSTITGALSIPIKYKGYIRLAYEGFYVSEKNETNQGSSAFICKDPQKSIAINDFFNDLKTDLWQTDSLQYLLIEIPTESYPLIQLYNYSDGSLVFEYYCFNYRPQCRLLAGNVIEIIEPLFKNPGSNLKSKVSFFNLETKEFILERKLYENDYVWLYEEKHQWIVCIRNDNKLIETYKELFLIEGNRFELLGK